MVNMIPQEVAYDTIDELKKEHAEQITEIMIRNEQQLKDVQDKIYKECESKIKDLQVDLSMWKEKFLELKSEYYGFRKGVLLMRVNANDIK